MIIPNAFQCHNDYVDRGMQYLSGTEFKVLLCAVRHILGWHDSIATRENEIKMTTFIRVTGLSRGAASGALKELMRFGFLSKKGRDTWRLNESPAWEHLERREQERREQAQKRTEKARARNPRNVSPTVKLSDSPTVKTEKEVDSPTDKKLTVPLSNSDSPTDTIYKATSKATSKANIDISAPDEKPKRKTKKQLEAEQRDADRAIIKGNRYWKAFAAAYPFPDIVEPQTHELAAARETIVILEKANVTPENVTGYVKAKTAGNKGFAFSWLSGAANLHEVINFKASTTQSNGRPPAPSAQPTQRPAHVLRTPVTAEVVRLPVKKPNGEKSA